MYGVAVVLEVVVDGDDVRMAERPGHPRLAQEPLGERRVGGVEGGELLQRDGAVEVGLPGQVHGRHAAATDLSEHLVAADGALICADTLPPREARSTASVGQGRRG